MTNANVVDGSKGNRTINGTNVTLADLESTTEIFNVLGGGDNSDTAGGAGRVTDNIDSAGAGGAGGAGGSGAEALAGE